MTRSRRTAMITGTVIGKLPTSAEETSLCDAELVAGLVAGGATAVAAVDAMIQRAARPFRRRLRNQWDDVLQDARMEVFTDLARGRFRGESRLATYVWRVVSHTCLDALRASARRRWTALEDLDPGLEPAVADDRPASLDTADLARRVLEAVPPHCLRIWRLIVEGFSYREISRVLSVAEGALRVRALRCRRHALAIREELLAGRPPAMKQMAELDA